MTEIELKLAVSADPAARAQTLDALKDAMARARAQTLDSWYFDTADEALRDGGFTLRVRRAGKQLLQTIKQDSGSVSQRGEWERPIDGKAPTRRQGASAACVDFAMISETPLAELAEAARPDLRQAFHISVKRAFLSLSEENAQIEAVLDSGEITVPGPTAAEAIFEVELELKSGGKSAVYTLARRLAARAPLSISLISKAERGYRLAAGASMRPAKGSQPRLGDAMTAGAAFEAICNVCLHDFMLNARLLTARPAPAHPVEAIHQGRVALRRLRAALALFQPIAGDEYFAAANDELKRMARLFGAARDRDVMHEAEIKAARGELTGEAREFAAWRDSKRLALRAALIEAIEAKPWRIFLIDFCEWLGSGGWRAKKAERADTAKFIRKRLAKRRKALLQQGENLEGLDPEARHKVRIDAKKLRYMAEFFIDCPEVADKKSLGALLKRLETIQWSLGEMHDAETRLDADEADLRLWRQETGRVESGELALADAPLAAPAEDGQKWLGEALRAFAKLAKDDPF
ncbi:CHAD domain containing protein [Methylocella silvestris BL2]|uniref:CHAD domain containing protein n=1 Tax=Methylocella silvestris (strain DSM 15510 / CIP 108128 / LMG 27833 / NCIMB 13906 / BL2) TaxID=395965 RepID=B8ETS0_METSB|nr:CYTH and CHAD domain-containing protein [Methylocella silvestris]ACK52422.1 CHAD domain containing protein [Methylocella silvestris BL2]